MNSLRLTRLLLCLVGALLFAATSSAKAQAEAVQDTLIQRLQSTTLALARDYPQLSRDIVLSEFAAHYNARSQPESTFALLTSFRAGLTVLQPFIQQRMAARDVDGALAIISLAGADSATKAQARLGLLHVAAQTGDTASFLKLVDTTRDAGAQVATIQEIVRHSRDSSATRFLLDLASLLIPQLSRDGQWIAVLQLVRPAASIGDLSFARMLDTLHNEPHGHAQLVADLGAYLRVKNDGRADSVYTRALELASRVDSTLGSSARNYYWAHFMPALSDTNPLRLLAQMDSGFTRRTFLRGVMAIHLGNGRSEVPIRVMNEFAARGDTSRAVYMALEPYTHPIDYFLWQPFGRQEALPPLLRRALELTAGTRDTTLRAWVRAMAIDAFRERDTALVSTLRRELRLSGTAPISAVQEARELVMTNPEAALERTAAISDTSQREWVRSMAAYMLSEKGRHEAAYLAADGLASASRRAQSRLMIAFRDSTTTNRARVLAVIQESMLTFRADSGYTLVRSYLVPLMLRQGMTREAVEWAERQPVEARALAMIALLRALWARTRR
jgi:hypothetical protein